jgi:acyl carrier protein
VTEAVLALVAEQTGYPREMLALDLDLEADLGVDTVKQAELFAAVRSRYGIERDPDLKLRDFNTLARVIEFVFSRRPDLRPGAAPAAAAPAPAPAATVAAPESAPLRRVPAPALRPPLDFLRPTGVALAQRDRVVVAFDRGSAADALSHTLAARGVEVLALDPTGSEAEVEARLADWQAGGPIRGLYWLPALDPLPEPERLDLAAWREALRQRAKLLAVTLRALDGTLSAPGAFAIAATRMGGAHGADAAGAAEPAGGAVAGLVKAFAREHATTLVKVVDFETGAASDDVAHSLLLEAEVDAGAVEIGWQRGERLALALVEAPPASAEGGLELGPDSVCVVTGAAGSIVSAIVADLARAGGTFHLLDLAAAPDPQDPEIALFRADRDRLKRELGARMTARGERATPVAIERELAGIERRSTALAAMAEISAHGGHAHYHAVDLCDGAAVARALAPVVAGRRVDLVLHAAGLEISRRLADKPQAEFDRVFDVKADGWFNLLAALGSTPIAAVAAFSSIAGRFGNAGQTDYAAANELLAKSISNLVRRRPGTRGLVLDWTGWAEIGMASRGSIPQLLRAAGIDLLRPEQGIPVLRRELASLTGYRELVVAHGLGDLLAERDPRGALDLAAVDARAAQAGPMAGGVAGFGLHDGLTLRVRLDPAREPFLHDHRIDGTPVLPGVMGIEAFAEAATLLWPDRPLLAIEQVEFLAPFKFFRDEPREVEVQARARAEGEQVVVDCRLFGSRRLPGQEEPQRTLHFAGRVRLGARGAVAEAGDETSSGLSLRAVVDGGPAIDAASIYRVYFHGPAYQVLAAVHRAGRDLVGQMPATLPAEASRPTRVAPRAIELAFQTAGVADLAERGRLALPWQVERVTLHGAGAVAAGAWRAELTPDAELGAHARVFDADGRLRLRIEGYRTVDLPGEVDPALAAPWRALAEVDA